MCDASLWCLSGAVRADDAALTLQRADAQFAAIRRSTNVDVCRDAAAPRLMREEAEPQAASQRPVAAQRSVGHLGGDDGAHQADAQVAALAFPR